MGRENSWDQGGCLAVSSGATASSVGPSGVTTPGGLRWGTAQTTTSTAGLLRSTNSSLDCKVTAEIGSDLSSYWQHSVFQSVLHRSEASRLILCVCRKSPRTVLGVYRHFLRRWPVWVRQQEVPGEHGEFAADWAPSQISLPVQRYRDRSVRDHGAAAQAAGDVRHVVPDGAGEAEAGHGAGLGET